MEPPPQVGMDASAIDLYWIPLGAGGRSVRWNGRIYEALASRREHRPSCNLYHAALVVTDSDGTRFVIEMAPAWSERSSDRGVVRKGPVGAKLLGRCRAFQYEVRCWRNGRIADLADAVQSPNRVSTDPRQAAALLDLVITIPPLTWGRDELGSGDMWNSNSLVAWLLARSGQDMGAIQPPDAGRAPGWNAGLALAARQQDGQAVTVDDGSVTCRPGHAPVPGR
jgi:hypothetical protein